MNYMPAMDGLRAAAVLLVLHHHWFQPDLPLAGWGVTLFFVISGYLITKSIDTLRTQSLTAREAATQFFLKRSLRLFPAYYLCVAFGLATSEWVRDNAIYFLTYTTNFLVWQRGTWDLPFGTATWSLAVEEQFYLIWFFVVFFFSTRNITVAIVSLFATAPLCRLVNLYLGSETNTLLIMQTDGLVAGAALYFLEKQDFKKRLPYWLALLALALYGVLSMATAPQANLRVLGSSLVVAAACVLVWNSRYSPATAWERGLAAGAVTYTGRISYGLYLYHMITPELARILQPYVPGIWQLHIHGTWDGFVGHVLMTFMLAAISYKLIELPIRNLYQPRRALVQQGT